jgi:hypothetical protein
LPFAEKAMEGFGGVALEEPHTPGFEEMLSGELDIEQYLQLTDYEFPEYSRRSCELLRRLYAGGTAVYQVDPFMDELVRIHEFFAEGGTPQELKEGTPTRAVYECERMWTGRLIGFYERSMRAGFDGLVRAVQAFAAADAEKGRMRDQMRAERLIELLPDLGSLYVEAGYIHFALFRELMRRIPSGWRLRPVHIMESVSRPLCGRRRPLGPGDVLTLLYTCRPGYAGNRDEVLAARSLVYNKMIEKEEMSAESADYPHLRDECEVVRTVGALTYEQCRRIYERVRRLPTREARSAVLRFLEDPHDA